MLASTSAELLPKHRIGLAASLRLLGISLLAVAGVLTLEGLLSLPGMSATEKAALLVELLLLAGLLWVLKRRWS